jgi:hypothetical protein
VSVQPLTSTARVHPGGTATYVIWVWSTRASTKGVTVDAAIGHVKGTAAPRFSVCPNSSGASCALGTLPRGQADELQAKVKVRKAAHPGRDVTLTATAKATGAVSFSAGGSFKIVSAHKPAAASPAPTTPAPSAASVPPLPPIPPVPAPSSTNGTSPAGLFPTVSPRPSNSSSASSTTSGHRNSRSVKATSAADTLPLNPRLIGGQLAGLVVLAAAITIAIARLSLRPQRSQDGKGPAAKQ